MNCRVRTTTLLGLLLLNFFIQSSSPSGVCQTGDIRLAGGSSFLEGRVEICFGGDWGTVCDDLWDQTDASVACNQLGFSKTGAQAIGASHFGEGQGLIYLDELLCTGNETNLFECRIKSDCIHAEDAGVRCQNDGVSLLHEGMIISNNSLLSLDALGDLNASTTNPLFCVTTLTSCCDTNRTGNWFSPDGTSPLGTTPNPPYLHQSWGDDQSIRLHRPSGAASTERGLYRCEVPDIDNVIQTIYVGIYASVNEGAVSISNLTYERSSQTLVCTSTGGPATSVSWSKDGDPLVVDGITYQQSQVITDTASATYENRLTITVKKTSLSGLYACMVLNSRGNGSSELEVTVCRDGDVRFLDSGLAGPQLEICKDDIWNKLQSNLQIESKDDIIQDLVAVQTPPSIVTLSWSVADSSILRYDVSCSNSKHTHTIHLLRGAESAILNTLLPSLDYQCCVLAYLDRKLLNVATYVSKECKEVRISGIAVVDSQPRIEGSSTLTYALAILVVILLVSVALVAIGCVCILVSKRKYQKTHPRRQHVDINTASHFLVDNPIYKTSGSVASLVGSENCILANGNGQLDRSFTPLTTQSSTHLSTDNNKMAALASNPQYGSSQPINQQRRRYVDVVSDTEPAYELLPESRENISKLDKKNSAATGDPIYSVPVPVHLAPKLPVYESTTDIPATVGKDGEYAKLNHN